MKVLFKNIAAVVTAVTISSAVPATALTLDLIGPAAGDHDKDYKIVNVTVPSISFDDDAVYAGAYDMTDTTPNSVLGDFVAFCLDLAAWIGTGTGYEYKITDTPFSNSLITNGGVDRIQAIFDANYNDAVATESRKNSAAFQVALWNAVYDDDWTVGGGDFTATGGNGVISQANAYLAAAENYAGGQKWRLSYLESTATPYRYQNLVTMAPVPLPAAGVLLLGALGGLGLMRRRRKAA